MLKVDFDSRREQRNFGLVLASAFTVLAAFRYWRSGEPPYILLPIAMLLTAFALAAPRALKPLFRAWIALAEVLNWLVTRIVLTFAFFFLLLPTALIVRLRRKRLLKRDWDADAVSYWEESPAYPETIEKYKRQF